MPVGTGGDTQKTDMITISTGDLMKLILRRPIQFVVVEVPQIPFQTEVCEPEHILEEPVKIGRAHV